MKNRYNSEMNTREMRQVGGIYPSNGMKPLNLAAYAAGGVNNPPINAMPDVPNIRMADAQGRIFQPITYFGPLPSNGPVAIPIPSTVVQTTPIVAPISLVPYMTLNQPLWQYEDDTDN